MSKNDSQCFSALADVSEWTHTTKSLLLQMKQGKNEQLLGWAVANIHKNAKKN